MTGQNRFARSLSGGYKITNGSGVHKLFFKNGRRSNQSQRILAVDAWTSALRMANGDGK